MRDAWYYANRNGKVGPLSLQMLRETLSTLSAENRNDVLVWHEGFPDWKPAHDIAELNAELTPLPPPLPNGFTTNGAKVRTIEPQSSEPTAPEDDFYRRVGAKEILGILGILGASLIFLLFIGYLLSPKSSPEQSKVSQPSKIEAPTANSGTATATNSATQSGSPQCPSDKAFWTNCEGSRTLNGDKYVGEFRNNKGNGQGTLTSPDGGKYVGGISDGEMNGQGTLTSPDGEKYVGEFRDGKMTGQGTMFAADGTKITVACAACPTLGPSDIEEMHRTYNANQAKFKRDYVGKIFAGALPVWRVRENVFIKGRFAVSLGEGTFNGDIDCEVSDPATIEQITNWDKGHLVAVAGVVRDHVTGSIMLDNCKVGG